MGNTSELEFWFDFASPYSYLSALRIEALSKDQVLEIAWCPFLLGVIFNKQGWNDSPFNLYPAKGQYMWRDIARVCHDRKISYQKPSQFPRNGLLAARVACCFSDSSWTPEFVKAVFRANFELDQDISDQGVISQCLNCSEENPSDLIAQATSTTSKEKLRLQTDRAYRKGIFGAPSFLVADELFWGDDRLENAIEWAL